MAPCSLVNAHGFGGIYCLRFQDSSMASDPSKQSSRLHNPLQAAVSTGQTGRPFKVRFQEHLQNFKCKNNSKFAQHPIDNKHAIGPMEDIMEVVHVTKKCKLIDTLECFHIYKETKAGNQISDRLTAEENAMFKTIIQEDPSWGRSALTQPSS